MNLSALTDRRRVARCLAAGAVCLAWLWGGVLAGARAADLVLLDGRTEDATLVSGDAAGLFQFQSGAETHATDLAGLIGWGAPAELAPGPVVVLADGGLLPAVPVGLTDETLLVESALLGPLALPLPAVAGLVLASPVRALPRDRLLLGTWQAEGTTDLLVLTNGDQLAGTLTGCTPEQATFAAAAGAVSVEWEKLERLVCNPALRAGPPQSQATVLCGLSDGTLVRTRQFACDDAIVSFEAAGVPAACPRAELRLIQPLGTERCLYLSDLTPMSYKHVPFFTLAWDYATDANVVGGRLRARGRLSAKGLGMHSASRLTYRLPGPCRRFEALLALDDVAGADGSITARVLADAETRFVSGDIRGGDAPVPVSVDLSGARSVTLLIDFGERGDLLDRADWLWARVLRE